MSPPGPRVDARPGLAAAAGVGPFFAVADMPDQGGWRSLRELTEADEAMDERVASAAELLSGRAGGADLEPRVVASTVVLGLAARLVAPALGSVVLTGVLPLWTPDDLWWQAVPGGPWPLACTSPAGVEVEPAAAASAFVAGVVDTVVAPVLSRVQSRYALSPQVLWGNVASALGGALTMLTTSRRETSEVATALVADLLGHGPLAGTAELTREGGRPRLARRSCCLFYRVPGGGLCGDCVLAVS